MPTQIAAPVASAQTTAPQTNTAPTQSAQQAQQNFGLDNKQYDCIKSIENFRSTTYLNICANSKVDISHSGFQMVERVTGITGILIGIILVAAILIKILRD